jgi:hypothetical protein
MSDEPDAMQDVTVRRDGAVLHITLNTPHNGNLVSAAMGAAVIEALTGLDKDVRVVCLRGAGADFCAGRVSPTPAKGAPPPSAERLRQMVALPALDLYDAIKAALPVSARRSLPCATSLWPPKTAASRSRRWSATFRRRW